MALRIPPEWTRQQQVAHALVLSLKSFQAGESVSESTDADRREIWKYYESLTFSYIPHHQLPPAGQRLWRKVEDALERPDITFKKLRKAVEKFCQWLVENYSLGRVLEKGSTPGTQALPKQELNEDTPSKPVSRRERSDKDVLFLRLILSQHHKLDSDWPDYTAAKQEQIMEWLKWPQSKVSRVMKRLYGGMKRYCQACRRRNLDVLRAQD
jgi:hypothetical protein